MPAALSISISQNNGAAIDSKPHYICQRFDRLENPVK
jgi:hypothetical protein